MGNTRVIGGAVDEATCCQNQCTCTNGNGGSGSACPTPGAAKCMSCNNGYTLTGTVCQGCDTITDSNDCFGQCTWQNDACQGCEHQGRRRNTAPSCPAGYVAGEWKQ